MLPLMEMISFTVQVKTTLDIQYGHIDLILDIKHGLIIRSISNLF